jgi:hypothetical protein
VVAGGAAPGPGAQAYRSIYGSNATWILTPDTAFKPSTKLTLETWVELNNRDSSGQAYASWFGTTVPNASWLWWYQRSGGNRWQQFSVYDSSGNLNTWRSPYFSPTLTNNTWHHIAVTIDLTLGTVADQAEFYYGGSTQGTSVVVANGGVSAFNDPTPGQDFYLAAASTPNSTDLLGGEDDFRYWVNHVRTPSEISSNYNSQLTGNEANLTAYWGMNEGTGTTAADATVNGYDLTAHTTAPTWGSDTPFA